jgi:hypothetical protein
VPDRGNSNDLFAALHEFGCGPEGDLSVYNAISDEALHKTCFPCHVPAKSRDYDFAG